MKQNAVDCDSSDYPKNHPLYSSAHKKEIGKMKDECGSLLMTEFVGLRLKLYSYTTANPAEHGKKAKGVKKNVIRNNITHEQYKQVLFNDTAQHNRMKLFRSRKHQMTMDEVNKVSLSAFDDKRFLVDEIQSYAYGHYKIKQL